MNELKNRAFALINAWTTAEVSTLAPFVHPKFEEIDRPEATAVELDGLGEKIALFHKVHTQITVTVHKQISDGDLVCTQWLMTAKVRPQPGASDEEPQTVFLPCISWTYFDNGSIVKNRVYRDIVGYLQQRGYTWAPAGARTPAPEETEA